MHPTHFAPQLELAARTHPDPTVARAGFALDHPYVEQCWGAIAGPSAVALLRRLPVLWRRQEPAVVDADELARSLGLGASHGVHSRFSRTLERVVRFGLGEWADPGAVLAVNLEVRPLSPRQLDRVPGLSRQAHEQLLATHLDGLAAQTVTRPSAAALIARLDRLQHKNGADAPTLGR